MDTAQLTAIHNSLAKRIKLYEQRTGEFPPVDVLNEMRYGFRAALELLDQRSQRDADPTLEAISSNGSSTLSNARTMT